VTQNTQVQAHHNLRKSPCCKLLYILCTDFTDKFTYSPGNQDVNVCAINQLTPQQH